MTKDLEKLLNEFGRDTVDAIVSEIVRKDVIKTGALKSSIDYDIVNDGETIKIQFKMLDYGKFVDEGTRYIKAREFFNKVIERKTNDLGKDLEDEIANEFYKSLGIK
jgi:hypothetical protein